VLFQDLGALPGAVGDQQVDPLGSAVDRTVVGEVPIPFKLLGVTIGRLAMLVQDSAGFFFAARVLAHPLQSR
jgi:hypothetical protein